MKARPQVDEPFMVKPIGVVHSDLKTGEAVIKAEVDEVVAQIELFKEYEVGLSDIEGFSHLIVVCWMHEAAFKSLKVRPLSYPDTRRGIFATRHPDRPNPIAVTIVELMGFEGFCLRVKGLDMIDGTPVLDIKPYTKGDRKVDARFGWLAQKNKTCGP